MFGVNAGIKVKYLKDGKEKISVIDAFKYVGKYAELYLSNGDTINEEEVIEEINEQL